MRLNDISGDWDWLRSWSSQRWCWRPALLQHRLQRRLNSDRRARHSRSADGCASRPGQAPTIAFSGFSSTNEFWLTLARAAEEAAKA